MNTREYDYKTGYAKNKSIMTTGRKTFTFKENLTFHMHQPNVTIYYFISESNYEIALNLNDRGA